MSHAPVHSYLTRRTFDGSTTSSQSTHPVSAAPRARERASMLSATTLREADQPATGFRLQFR